MCAALVCRMHGAPAPRVCMSRLRMGCALGTGGWICECDRVRWRGVRVCWRRAVVCRVRAHLAPPPAGRAAAMGEGDQRRHYGESVSALAIEPQGRICVQVMGLLAQLAGPAANLVRLRPARSGQSGSVRLPRELS